MAPESCITKPSTLLVNIDWGLGGRRAGWVRASAGGHYINSRMSQWIWVRVYAEGMERNIWVEQLF